jgi:hypothetical protein
MSASIALQKDVMVAYLGPVGSFSHDVKKALKSKRLLQLIISMD